MYPSGRPRIPSSLSSLEGRQPSWARFVPPPQSQAQVPKPENAPEAEKEGFSGKRSTPSRQPSSATRFPESQSQVPKQEPMPDRKAVGAKKEEEEPSVPPASKEAQLVSSASQSENTETKMITPKDGVADEEASKVATVRNGKSLQNEIKNDISNLTRRLAELHAQQKIALGNQKQPGEELGVRVITMAGENRGATMDLGSALQKQDAVDILKGYKLNGDFKWDSGVNAKPRGKARSEEAPVNAYVNSNVQGANNSILYNSNCHHRDPGVQVALSNTPVLSLQKAISPYGKHLYGKGNHD